MIGPFASPVPDHLQAGLVFCESAFPLGNSHPVRIGSTGVFIIIRRWNIICLPRRCTSHGRHILYRFQKLSHALYECKYHIVFLRSAVIPYLTEPQGNLQGNRFSSANYQRICANLFSNATSSLSLFKYAFLERNSESVCMPPPYGPRPTSMFIPCDKVER